MRDVYKAFCNQTESGTREKIKDFAGEREEEAICNRSEEKKKSCDRSRERENKKILPERKLAQ